MNSYERMFNRIQGKPVDRVPNMNIVMQFAARDTDRSYGQVVRNARLLADGVLHCHEKYGIDCDSLIEGWLSQIDTEVENNGDGSFLSDRLSFMKRDTPYPIQALHNSRAYLSS